MDNLSTWLHKQQLANLVDQASALAEHNRDFQSIIDFGWHNQCRLAAVNGHAVVVHCDNAAIATQLRYQSQHILQQLQQFTWGKSLKYLDCKVKPTVRTQQPVERKANKLSPGNSQLLRDTAQTVKNPRLKAALNQLAKHTKP